MSSRSSGVSPVIPQKVASTSLPYLTWTQSIDLRELVSDVRLHLHLIILVLAYLTREIIRGGERWSLGTALKKQVSIS